MAKDNGSLLCFWFCHGLWFFDFAAVLCELSWCWVSYGILWVVIVLGELSWCWVSCHGVMWVVFSNLLYFVHYQCVFHSIGFATCGTMWCPIQDSCLLSGVPLLLPYRLVWKHGMKQFWYFIMMCRKTAVWAFISPGHQSWNLHLHRVPFLPAWTVEETLFEHETHLKSQNKRMIQV